MRTPRCLPTASATSGRHFEEEGRRVSLPWSASVFASSSYSPGCATQEVRTGHGGSGMRNPRDLRNAHCRGRWESPLWSTVPCKIRSVALTW
eukprot:636625-Rhodomonas_salina.2